MMLIMLLNGCDDMPWTKGKAKDLDDLADKIITYVTNKAIHGDYTWELKRNLSWPMGIIFKCPHQKDNKHFYVGIMTNKIKVGKTYSDWFFSEKNYSSYFIWQKNGANSLSSATSNAQWKKTPEIFLSNAHVMHFNLFKQYDEHLQWHEQPCGIDLTKTHSLCWQWKYPGSPSWSAFDLPLLPGIGCPSLSTDYDGPLDGYINYWIKKEKYHIVILIQNRNKWDCAAVGMFEPYHKGEYSFPGFVIGSTSGATACGEDRWYSPGQITPTADIGIMFDYSPNNWSLIHSIPPYVTAARDEITCPTSVALMRPDGTWEFVANWMQGVAGINEHVCAGPITKHYYYRTPPTRLTNISVFLRPGENSLEDFTNIISSNSKTIKYKLESLDIVEKYYDKTGIIGFIPSLKYPSHQIKEYGELTIDNKTYFVIPNIWDHRKLSLQNWANITYSENSTGSFSPNGLMKEIANSDLTLQKDLDRERSSEAMNMIIELD